MIMKLEHCTCTINHFFLYFYFDTTCWYMYIALRNYQSITSLYSLLFVTVGMNKYLLNMTNASQHDDLCICLFILYSTLIIVCCFPQVYTWESCTLRIWNIDLHNCFILLETNSTSALKFDHHWCIVTLKSFVTHCTSGSTNLFTTFFQFVCWIYQN